MANIHTKHCETIYRPKRRLICLKHGASSTEYCARNARKVTSAAEYSAAEDSTMSKWRIFVEIFTDEACEAIYKDRFLYFHMANNHRKHARHDLTRAIYLFLNGINPYNSIINIFKNHPCLKILVIFTYAIQVFMTMFAFVVGYTNRPKVLQ